MAKAPHSEKAEEAVLSDAVVDGVYAALLARVRAVMQEKKMTITMVARRAGLSRSEVSLFLSGKRNPTWKTLLRVSAALGTTMARLSQEAWRLYAGVEGGSAADAGAGPGGVTHVTVTFSGTVLNCAHATRQPASTL